MFRSNDKGQAFDVFKLLIAAVVALAMLMILLPILNNLGIFITKEPNKVASDLISNNYSNHSAYTEGDTVTFNSKTPQLNIVSIAENSKNISESLICIHTGDFKQGADEDFKFTASGKILQYTGSSQQKAKIAVLCDYGKRIAADFTDQGLTGGNEGLIGNIKCGDETDSLTSLAGNQTYCVLILRAA